MQHLSVMKIEMAVLKYAQTPNSAIPVLVNQAIDWQVMDKDVMVCIGDTVIII